MDAARELAQLAQAGLELLLRAVEQRRQRGVQLNVQETSVNGLLAQSAALVASPAMTSTCPCASAR